MSVRACVYVSPSVCAFRELLLLPAFIQPARNPNSVLLELGVARRACKATQKQVTQKVRFLKSFRAVQPSQLVP